MTSGLLVGSTMQLPRRLLRPIEQWLAETADSRPWHSDPKVLTVVEHPGIVEASIAALRSLGQAVVVVEAGHVYADAGSWKRALARVAGSVLFVRGMNVIDAPAQQSLWAAWRNATAPGSGVSRFAISVYPFNDDRNGVAKHDLLPKLNDLAVIVSLSSISLAYDPWRGGFCLQLGALDRRKCRGLFNGLVTVFLTEKGQVAALESFWGDHGGMPLRSLHKSESYPQGQFVVEGPEFRVGGFQLRQDPEKLRIWFSTGNDLPREHWSELGDQQTGIVMWLSRRKVKAGWPAPEGCTAGECPLLAGIEFDFSRTMVVHPIELIVLTPEDFK